MHYSKLLLAAAGALPIVSGRAIVHHSKTIVDTTVLPNGQIIDWVLSDEVAPPTGVEDTLDKVITPLNGPKGAVPYLRPSTNINSKVKELPRQDSGLSKRVTKGHKYAFTQQTVNNKGGGASFSLYDPYLENDTDFSLIQTAVSNTQVRNTYYGSIVQTLEAGWQKYPAYNPSPVHFFTFFNTNGYHAFGHNISGYNTDYAGWVQVDSNVYPGYSKWTHSVDGGQQYDIDLQYRLVDDKWWLAVNGRNIGYYPTWMFNQNVTTGSSLATTSNEISFYGEIYSDNDKTTSDMGSGEFPSAGYGKSAYMRNIVYADTQNSVRNYSANSNDNIITDPGVYNLETHFETGGNWGSYMYLGGPGYGKNVGS
ncbi:putative Glucoamylase [Cordyceps fumosorosea ARSEF 2679]|uniref:Putative Glucoamylase n=1 Tax=Cordyceps fumosorosea (strain ARSEF 2679) TaxID=1081104 RepID=A0A168B8X9_CORFA|nr:putative Glucoamylase [Cordyceps fumosorosea ARSEF 2679]OAA69785.1 putative Glucoamylase [Cordyceps fumosorosea ARSEF 2679]